MTATATLTVAQSDAVLDVTVSLVSTNHNDNIDVARGNFDCDRLHNGQPGVYVTGYKRAALDRCAFVTDTGLIEWIR